MQTTFEATPLESVTLNHEHQLYVIDQGDGYSCLGFDNARPRRRERRDQVQG